jgi:hypothetical protein
MPDSMAGVRAREAVVYHVRRQCAPPLPSVSDRSTLERDARKIGRTFGSRQ